MSEYIERGALLKAIGCENAVKYGNKSAEQQHKSYSSMMLYEIADEINDAPAADVEPVVRCGRCKYALIDAEGFVETCEYWNEEFNTFHLTTMHPDGYCSNGVERSGSGE